MGDNIGNWRRGREAKRGARMRGTGLEVRSAECEVRNRAVRRPAPGEWAEEGTKRAGKAVMGEMNFDDFLDGCRGTRCKPLLARALAKQVRPTIISIISAGPFWVLDGLW